MARHRSRNDFDDDDLPRVKINLRTLREAAHLYRYLLPYWPKFAAALVTLTLATALAEIQETIVLLVRQFLRQCVTLVGGVVLIAWTSGRLTLLMLSSLPVLIAIAVLFGRFIRRNSKQTQDRLAESNVIVEETLQGVATVKAFANEGYEEGRYHDGLHRVLAAALRAAKYRGAFYSFIVFALFGAVVVVLWY